MPHAPWYQQRRPLTLPSGVDPARNGLLFPDEMRQVFLPGIGMGTMEAHAAQAWDCLAMYFNLETGMQLTQTSRGYRSLIEQVQVFDGDRYPATGRWTTRAHDDNGGVSHLQVPIATRVWNDQTWFLRRRMALTATPGKSNHGLGLAADLAYWVERDGKWGFQHIAGNGLAMGWLELHAHEFGFYWNVRSEQWHVEYCAGDDTPQRIIDTHRFFGKEWI